VKERRAAWTFVAPALLVIGAFFIVVIGSFLPGSTVPWVSRRLDVLAPNTQPTIESPIIVEQPQGDMQLRMFRIEPTVAVFGATVGERTPDTPGP